MRQPIITLCAVLAVASVSLAEAPRPLDGEIQVNSYITDDQLRSAVAVDAQGKFLVIWDSEGSSGTDDSSWSIQAQLFEVDGSPDGSEFQVNSYTTSHQFSPAIAVDGQGNFVVTWHSNGSYDTDNNQYSIQAQRYDREGSPIGTQFQVNSYTTSQQSNPVVAADTQGDFVVVWQSYRSAGTDKSQWSIQAQRFDSDGIPAGGQFQVNSYTTHIQSYPAATMDNQGGFVVAWQSRGSSGTDSSLFSIQAQRYDLDGVPQGTEFQVNSLDH